MSVSRKENDSLVKKAGIGIVDNILNRFSHNAISNSAVTEAITEINNDLTKKALVNTYYDSSTKKLYEVNSDGTQGGEIKMTVKLNYDTPLFKFSSNALTYTATKDCYLVGTFTGTTGRMLSVKNTVIARTTVETTALQINLPISQGDIITINAWDNAINLQVLDTI